MVKRTPQLDSIFGALADPTRRDILRRVAKKMMSVSEVALPYDLSLPAVSKHLRVLERAQLIVKHRQGKQLFIQLAPGALQQASQYLHSYEAMWNDRFDALEEYLKKNK